MKVKYIHTPPEGPVRAVEQSRSKKVKKIKKALDRLFFSVIVHTMNQIANRNSTDPVADVPKYQLEQFQELILKLFQCCQERMQYQCERFGLPDAEFRCLI
ncbi:MAG: hypothetical protein P8X80_16080, partial [Desulfobacterales bacterium]